MSKETRSPTTKKIELAKNTKPVLIPSTVKNSKIFPATPILKDEDKDRLTEGAYLRSWNWLNRKLIETDPGEEDLKKLILMELEKSHPRPPIVLKLIVRLQKKEREAIMSNIMKSPSGKRLRDEMQLA